MNEKLIFAVARKYHGKSLKAILHIEKNYVDIYFLFITLSFRQAIHFEVDENRICQAWQKNCERAANVCRNHGKSLWTPG